jgi:putative endonuclease
MGTDDQINIGKTGETVAANYLIKNGYSILEMNFQNNRGYRMGEIDIVAKDRETEEIVFAEVKTRQSGRNYSDHAELAINRSKYRKLSKIIFNYLRRNNMMDNDYRLDAISIEMDIKTRRAKLKHLKYIYY